MFFLTQILVAPLSSAIENQKVAKVDAQLSAALTCTELPQQDFTQIPGAASSVLSAQLVMAAGDMEEYCAVKGYIEPQIQFEMRLPTKTWNGRYFQAGCGGFCGVIYIDECADTLAQNFAVAANNMGHVGNPYKDPIWGSDAQLREDFGPRSTHAMAVAGKAIVERYYGKKPAYSYFRGCSTGGREGLLLAQHFPEDFDGIVAGAPAFPGRLGPIGNHWDARQLFARDGAAVFTKEKLATINRAVLKHCDALDGLKDGILSDPRDCDFDVTTLACPRGRDNSNCLSAKQVESALRLYDGPRNSAGKRLVPSYVPKGSELSWALSPLGIGTWADGFFKYLAFDKNPSATYNYWDFDFDTDMGMVEDTAKLYDPVAPFTDPDLSGLRNSGNKLLVYHGWSDTKVSPILTIDYYAEVLQLEGGVHNVHDWFRFFMVPGMFHCAAGGVPDTFDWMSAIMAWAEHGRAPDFMIASQYGSGMNPGEQGELVRTRPVYPYPARASYAGMGDVNEAANWKIIQPALRYQDDLDWIWEAR